MFRSALRAATAAARASRWKQGQLSTHIARRQAPLPLNRPFASASLPQRCPQCSAPLPTSLPACPKCQYISGVPSSASYYELLGLELGSNPFSVDTASLRRNFLQAQRVCHPDTWSGQPREKKDLADHMSSLINEAYKTLLDPLRRTQYLLKLKGHETSESDQLDDPELIMEVMEEREQLEEATEQDQVDEIKARNLDKIKELVGEIEQLVGVEDWEEVKKAAVRLKYLQGIHDAAQAWPNSHFDH
ncbi:Co-chaperone Hsc20 [Gloeophyllum trabeum ATCC 11539]|uniref:Co-chaperone Hsc20 n=1 Tax=Gloeophyllum trabeum (strain ATCC 11539 / FP-39264 / Madison 617) TaxID=670483 RepID=S7S454_GLOTA|nr:Co-chaperone Hsc20 [Gloeophyllum trabeum ATCC 11539]EPQ60644.1 Co-chaperone Hsc20 [Gloeophyllum trabeum ATCC 11539]